jgi:hypothetical protein
MTEPGRASRCQAILIGVAKHAASSRLGPLPAAANSLRELAAVLTDPLLCGWSPSSVVTIADPENAGRLADRLETLAAQAQDVLLVYFVGHGNLTEEGQLYLTLSDTVSSNTGLEYEKIRRALRASTARVKIVILDCCFAGRAIESLGASFADSTATRGAYILTASHGAGTAHVPPLPQQVAACTSFTGQLVQLVRDGVPAGPAHLSLDDLYPQLRHALGALGLPKPDKRCDGNAGDYPFTRNAFTATDHADTVTLTEPEWIRLMRAKRLGDMIRSRRARVRERAMVELARMRHDPCPIVATQVAVFLDEVAPRARLLDLAARLAGALGRVRAGLASWPRPRGRVMLPVLSVATVLVLLGGYLMWHHSASNTANAVPGGGDAVLWQRTLADGPRRLAPQCVGVTDGRPDLMFNTPSATVRGLLAGVAASNAREAARPAGDLVTIVLATALSGTSRTCDDANPPVAPTAVPGCASHSAAGASPIGNDASALSFPSDIPSGLDQLRGVLTAICAQESDATLPARRPRIRLLVANVGAGFAFADQVVAEVARARAASGVIGVIGLNQSQPQTADTLQALDAAHIATLGTTLAADGYTARKPDGSRRYPSFFRVGTANARDVGILYPFMTANPARPTAGDTTLSAALHRPDVCLVEPIGDDTYSVNLSQDLLAHVQAPVFAYTVDAAGNVRQAPTPGGRPTCQAATANPRTSAFFFTGRVNRLAAVLKLLRDFPAEIPVIGGDDPGQLGAPSVNGIDRDVYYSEGGYTFSLSDQSATGRLAEYRDRSGFGFGPFLAAAPPVFGQAAVTPKAMIAFDAMWVLLHAVDAVSQATPDALGSAGASRAVISQVDGVCGAAAVRASTGLISFTDSGERTASLVVVHKLSAASGQITNGYSSGVPTMDVLRANMGGDHPASCPPPAA